jgi:hypothetical protein
MAVHQGVRDVGNDLGGGSATPRGRKRRGTQGQDHRNHVETRYPGITTPEGNEYGYVRKYHLFIGNPYSPGSPRWKSYNRALRDFGRCFLVLSEALYAAGVNGVDAIWGVKE